MGDVTHRYPHLKLSSLLSCLYPSSIIHPFVGGTYIPLHYHSAQSPLLLLVNNTT